MKKITVIKVLSIFCVVLAIQFLSACTDFTFLERTPSTPIIADAAGEKIPDSINILEPVNINNMKQWLCIRGESADNPILLIIHGGPGFAITPWREMFISPELEAEYTVVLWDQRGAGRSYNARIPDDEMEVSDFVQDTITLIDYLLQRFEKEKLFLMGHSWGSALGFLSLAAMPDYETKVAAYISANEAVHWNRRQQLSFDLTLERAYEQNNSKAIESLEGLRPFNPESNDDIDAKNEWVREFFGEVSDPEKWNAFKKAIGKTPESTNRDLLRMLASAKLNERLSEEIAASGYNLFETFPESRVPLYFFVGAKDLSTPASLVYEYNAAVSAPYNEVIMFEKAAHCTFLINPEKFTTEMLEIKQHVLSD